MEIPLEKSRKNKVEVDNYNIHKPSERESLTESRITSKPYKSVKDL